MAATKTRRETFEVADQPKVELRNLPSGSATFLAGEEGKVEIEVSGADVEEFVIEKVAGDVLLSAPERPSTRWESFDVVVRTPSGTSLGANVASADVEIEVGLTHLGFNSASGKLDAKNIEGNAGVNTASGDVRVERVSGNLGVNTASGDVKVREVGGNLGANTASGDLRVESAGGELDFTSASGDLEVGSFGGESLECTTQSGDVKISIPPGRTLDVEMNTLTGDIRNELDETPPPPPEPPKPGEARSDEDGERVVARLRVKTLSGDITLARAV